MKGTTSEAETKTRSNAENTTVVLLGTGMPRPDPAASGPATAIVVGKRVFLVDAGPGVMRQLAAAHLPIDGVTALFVTHLHSDHTLGYPDLIFTSWVMGRKGPLHAYGPHGFKQMTDHLVAAYAEDIKVRTEGLEHQTPDGFRVDANEIGPGIIYESDGVRVQAIAVAHGTWEEAFAYRIDTPDRSVVVSGDTRPHDDLVRFASGVDVLVHEVYASSKLKPEPRPGGEDWPRYMREYHTSDVELGILSARIQPKLLALNHIIRMGASDEELLAGVRSGGFTGRVIVGHDLDRC
ncbi:MAG: MBL fold metallo-hydrolase [Ignavibacteriales bacterium]|nr:MBL fold metallo-hydrolase [Ignavibacteriales bacterium]